MIKTLLGLLLWGWEWKNQRMGAEMWRCMRKEPKRCSLRGLRNSGQLVRQIKKCTTDTRFTDVKGGWKFAPLKAEGRKPTKKTRTDLQRVDPSLVSGVDYRPVETPLPLHFPHESCHVTQTLQMIKNYIKFYKITWYASASIASSEVFSTLLSYQVLYSVPVTPQGVYVKHSGKLNRTSVFYLLMSNHHFYNSPARDFAVWNTNATWKKLKEIKYVLLISPRVTKILLYYLQCKQASISIAFPYFYKIRAFRNKNFHDIYLMYFLNWRHLLCISCFNYILFTQRQGFKIKYYKNFSNKAYWRFPSLFALYIVTAPREGEMR